MRLYIDFLLHVLQGVTLAKHLLECFLLLVALLLLALFDLGKLV